MTAFATGLFALAAAAATWSLLGTVLRFAPAAAALRADLACCPEEMIVEWKSLERSLRSINEARSASLRKRPARRGASLDWPQVGASLELAA